MDALPKFSVLVPVYNEAATVETVLMRLRDVLSDQEIIVVDDGSRDQSLDIINRLAQRFPEIRVFAHTVNQGKGAALHTALQEVRGQYVIIQDADLEYDPQDIHALLTPLLDGRADVVFGSRFLGGPHRVLMFWHFVANKGLTLLTNILGNVNLSDMETCYKAFRMDAIRGLRLKAKRFGFEPEFTLRVCQKKLRIYETPISYSGRTYAEGKKITWKDGVSAVYWILRTGLTRC